jgi:hypothetical protein
LPEQGVRSRGAHGPMWCGQAESEEDFDAKVAASGDRLVVVDFGAT